MMRRTEDISILLTDKDFQKILSGWKGFSETEKAEVRNEYELTAEDVEILRRLWSGLDFHHFEHSKAIVEDTLNETVWTLAERNIAPVERKPVRKFYEQFARVAAILIIPILLYTTYIQFFKDNPVTPRATQQLVTISSQPGTVTNLILPDGSRVWLNAGSSVSYPSFFNGGTREVSLAGEAYFDVVKNKQMPMVVSAGDMHIKVYGTTFNVNAFSTESFVKVTLVEGSVSLSSPAGKFNGKEEFFIEPGQTVTFKEDLKKLVIQNDDPFLHTAWKDGIMVFRNNTFATVLKRLSLNFNVDIELKDQKLASIPMDATFRDESVEEILRLLSLGTPFRYYYGPTKKLTDGSFAKGKIYIEEK